ncbi:unnamed protein product [Darwinula stevensoni]|uniref:Uncharacterized protein n=1 Tax=Darwinula stevensoni TaxID=69355 RepID=A0A7R9AFX6_9CRUS|nr:unnamed protein product [Darwinula stevensoni]CAG0903397.1 unnamed protein product [Darwinula stevensoni]
MVEEERVVFTASKSKSSVTFVRSWTQLVGCSGSVVIPGVLLKLCPGGFVRQGCPQRSRGTVQGGSEIYGVTGGLSCVDPGAVSGAFGCRRPQAAQHLGIVHHHRNARALKETFHHLCFAREPSSIHRGDGPVASSEPPDGLTGGLSCVDPGAVSAAFGCRRPQAAQPLGMVHHRRNARALKESFHHLCFAREPSSIHRFLHAIVLEVEIPHGIDL